MEVGAVIERVERVAAVRVDVSADRSAKEAALVDVRRVRAWLDASETDLAGSLAEEVSFPEQAIAETSKGRRVRRSIGRRRSTRFPTLRRRWRVVRSPAAMSTRSLGPGRGWTPGSG